jgi:hypothetical protein
MGISFHDMGERRHTDMQHHIQEIWSDTQQPYHGPISAGLILFLSMVFVIYWVIKSYICIIQGVTTPWCPKSLMQRL